MDPLLIRTAVMLAIDLAALTGFAHTASPMPDWMRAASMAAYLASFPGATTLMLCIAEPRDRLRAPAVRWALRAVGIPIGVALLVPGFETAANVADGVRILGGFPRFLAGVAIGAAFAFKAFAEVLGWAFDSIPRLRLRFTALAVISALVAVGLDRWVFAPMLTHSAWGAIASMVSAVTVVWGLSSTASLQITRALEAAVEALRKLGQGDRSALLAEGGRGEVADLARAFNATVASLRDKEFVERAFGRYVAPGVLTALRARQGLQLAAERLDATVLFADIRGFTSLSESASPEEVMRVLNTYFSRVVEVVGAHEGYINKFIGDAIMVVFNAPAAQADHARRGIACGRGIQEALAALNAAGAFGARQLAVGVGVNTGPLVAGSLGGESRAEYTVIGDTVNVASRFTSAAKAGEVLVGERCAHESGLADLTPLEPIKVKGKDQPLPVFRAR